ncbi:hypothetical protein [Aquimarina agarivorans]|uniref:hypothetical protein n=1 Tax=Aquimarina agarivorans TaxID=980584 RepID=UPI000248E9D1|nr:hypothetical protein [Aquimarina agarivorans]
MKRVFSFFNIGIFLFVLYIVQYFLPVKWMWLYELQEHNQMYKRWSGLAVFLLIVFQWVLTISRVWKRLWKYSVKLTTIHKWIGAFSPILFYVHVMEFGYGYLALLSYLFFTNMLLGVVNLDIIKSKKNWVFQSWMITHVAFSIIITFVSLFHIGVVFYYE